jgi:hypothetical protein
LFYRLSLEFQEDALNPTTNNINKQIRGLCVQHNTVLKRLSELPKEEGQKLIDQHLRINRDMYLDHCTPSPNPSPSSSSLTATETAEATATATTATKAPTVKNQNLMGKREREREKEEI